MAKLRGKIVKSPKSVKALEELGRVRLSKSFFMRDMLYSEIANFHCIQNIPDHPEVAIEAGRRLCEELLEPLQERFGRISVRSAYRSPEVNRFGSEKGLGCARNEVNRAAHIWDHRDAEGRLGATACIVVNAFVDYYGRTGNWQAMAWWVHDHLPYNRMTFFSELAAFNLNWREVPERRIESWIDGRGRKLLTKPGAPGHNGSHAEIYAEWLCEVG
jgi:hypothetical protein